MCFIEVSSSLCTTKFRLDFDEKTSKSCSCQPELSAKFSHRTYLDDIDMLQLAQVLHFAYGGHVEAVFELPDLDLFDSDLSPCGNFMTYIFLSTCGFCQYLKNAPLYTTAYVPSPIFASLALTRLQ